MGWRGLPRARPGSGQEAGRSGTTRRPSAGGRVQGMWAPPAAPLTPTAEGTDVIAAPRGSGRPFCRRRQPRTSSEAPRGSWKLDGVVTSLSNTLWEPGLLATPCQPRILTPPHCGPAAGPRSSPAPALTVCPSATREPCLRGPAPATHGLDWGLYSMVGGASNLLLCLG